MRYHLPQSLSARSKDMRSLKFTYTFCMLALLVASGRDALAESLAEPIQIGKLSAQAGQVVSGYLDIAALNDAGTQIPVSIIHGAKPGPTLALIAGTHGYEYPGIIALQRLRQSINPEDVSGTLLLVHIANPPSFYGRTIYYSPADGQNLNRVYPGKADGTLSERIAFAITKEVIEQADFLIDLHAGDGNEALRPYVYLPETGQAELDAASRGLAIAFGLDHIVLDKGRAQPPEASLYTDQTAISRGIPAITTETGQLGLSDDYWVGLAEDGVLNVMRHLQMLPGEVTANDHVVWLEDYQVIRAPASGIFKAAVRDGYAIAGNGLLGELFDPFGERIAEIRAPFAGVVNYVLGTPPVSEGEPVAMVSKLAEL
jgi:predicted deacylase